MKQKTNTTRPATNGDKNKKIYAEFPGRILIIGFGSIGTGVLPLILRHIGIPRDRITILTGDVRGASIAKKEGIAFHVQPLRPDNYVKILDKYLQAGDFLVNLSVEVSSLDLVEFCRTRGILYLDTCIEPWPGGYADPQLDLSDRSNYGLREAVLARRKQVSGGPTAIVGHGANPGIVSHFVKQALLNIARDTKYKTNVPTNRAEWAALMCGLGVKVVHIAEYDSQVAHVPRKIGRFENTWSVEGFHAEGLNQPSELGWGTHEKYFPRDAKRHRYGCRAGIYLDQPGAQTLVRTWTPMHGSFLGRAVTHNESISIADFFTLRSGNGNEHGNGNGNGHGNGHGNGNSGKVIFRPTVHYAYRPCDAALLSVDECFGNNLKLQKEQRILLEEIKSGMDELGVLLMGHKKGAYWYGSQLTIEKARELAPYQNATGLQVTAGVLSGMIWAIEHPDRGIVEADELDFERVMEIIRPYMGVMVGAYSDWTPLKEQTDLFPETADVSDPWQFRNFRFA